MITQVQKDREISKLALEKDLLKKSKQSSDEFNKLNIEKRLVEVEKEMKRIRTEYKETMNLSGVIKEIRKREKIND